MATAQKVSAELNQIHSKMSGLAKVALYKAALDLVSAFDQASPVDSGTFRSEWDFKEENGGAGVMAQVTVFNRMPYAGVIEEGSPVGDKPWKSAGEKTVEQDGRIWSKQAVGGVMAPILDGESEFADELLHRIDQFVLGGF